MTVNRTLELRTRFRSFADGFGANPDTVDTAWTDLVTRYGEPHRHYHTLNHIGGVFDGLDRLIDRCDNQTAVTAAAFYHDVIYDPAARDDEHRSALHGSRMLAALNVDPPTVEEAFRLIRLTASHEVRDDDSDGAALIDADLSILAAPENEYDAYRHNIRQEYAGFDDNAYAAGRAAILSQFLARDHIFNTRTFQVHAEPHARANIERELAFLSTDTDKAREA